MSGWQDATNPYLLVLMWLSMGYLASCRIKKKRGKWIADITMTIPKPKPVEQDGVMGIDLGIKVPAVTYVSREGKPLLWQWSLSET